MNGLRGMRFTIHIIHPLTVLTLRAEELGTFSPENVRFLQGHLQITLFGMYVECA